MTGSSSASGGTGVAGTVAERLGRCVVLRGRADLTDAQRTWLGALRLPPGLRVVVVMVPAEDAGDLASVLTAVIDEVPGDRLVLAMSGAGMAPTAGDLAPAARIAADRGVSVVAPAGDVFLAPGGNLFVWQSAAEDGGGRQWWLFAPDRSAQPLGPRWPVPDWAGADGVAGLGALELLPVPAGLLLRPADYAAPDPRELAYAVPARRERPAILYDVPGELSDHLPTALRLLTSVSQARSGRLRGHSAQVHQPPLLIPVNGVDILPLGQALARENNCDVEVLTGFPVAEAAPAVAGPPAAPRVLLPGRDGRGAWSPFVGSVVCRPADRPRAGTGTTVTPILWRSPVPGLSAADPLRPVFVLDPNWHLTATRAGLWLHAPDAPADAVPRAPVSPDVVRLDVGLAGADLPADTPDALAGLVTSCAPGIRSRLRVTLHGIVAAPVRHRITSMAADLRIGFDDLATSAPDADQDAGSPPAGPSTVAALTAVARPAQPEEMPEPAFYEPPPVRFETAAHALSAFDGIGDPVETTPGRSVIRRSTSAQREEVRATIGGRWDTHAPAVRRALDELAPLPAADLAAAAVDLVALRLFLLADADDDLGPAAVASDRCGLSAFRVCLASGLSRLPIHRGVLVRGVDADLSGAAGGPEPGVVLTERGPVGGTSIGALRAGSLPPTAAMYAIWSQSARNLAPLLDGVPWRNQDTAATDPPGPGDVMLMPGTRFVVLESAQDGPGRRDVLLLQDIRPTGNPTDAIPAGRDGADRILRELDLRIGDHDPAPAAWPGYAVGALTRFG